MQRNAMEGGDDDGNEQQHPTDSGLRARPSGRDRGFEKRDKTGDDRRHEKAVGGESLRGDLASPENHGRFCCPGELLILVHHSAATPVKGVATNALPYQLSIRRETSEPKIGG